MGNGAFEIGIAETLLRLSSLEPHQVIHTVGETTKLAPSATPQSSPTNLVSSWRRLGNLYGSFRPHHLSGGHQKRSQTRNTKHPAPITPSSWPRHAPAPLSP